MPTSVFLGGSAGSSAWGSITGTLSAQTDLQSALDLKAPLVSPSFTTPTLGVAIGTSLALGGATIGSNALAATGTISVSGIATFGGALALATTSTDGIVSQNTTAATGGATVQISPRNRISGTAWDSDDSVSRAIQFFTEVLPSSAATVFGTWKLGYIDPVSSAITYPVTVGSTGILTTLSNINSGAAVNAATTLGFTSSTRFRNTSDGLAQITNDANTSGIGINVTTNGTLKLRNTAHNADGSLTALNGTFSGTLSLTNTGLRLLDTNASHHLIVAPGSNLTTDTTLTLTTGDQNLTLDVRGTSDGDVLTYDALNDTWLGMAPGGSVAVGDITGLGTGVATALAVNVGSAGAFTVYGGVGNFTTLTASSTAAIAGIATFGGALALATTSTDGLISQNTTASTGGVTVQISPRNRISGTAWDSDDSVSRTVSFFMEVLPLTGTTVAGLWKLGKIDPVSSAITYPLTVSTNNTVTILGDLTALNGNALFAAAGRFDWDTRSELTSPANGQMNLRMASDGNGVGFDVTTADVLQVRTKAQSAFGTVKAIHQTSTNATTGLTAGALSALTNASIELTDGTGQLYRIPCII